MVSKYCKIYDPEALEIAKGLRVFEITKMDNFVEESLLIKEENTMAFNFKKLYVSNSLACSCCNKSFVNYVEQRDHYKSDWHRYNLKKVHSGCKPVTEENFLLFQGNSSEMSASDNDLSSSSSDKNNAVKKDKTIKNCWFSNSSIKHIKIYFENEKNQVLSLYKCLLQYKNEALAGEDLTTAALNLIVKPKNWMIVLLGGGHFAAAIFDNKIITHHKTFHSYTNRSKQGGSQFTKDKKSGHHLKSAGASLRRYNEQALTKHVQEILSTWSDIIKQCNLILYRASGPWNKSILFDSKKAPFCKTDKRLRNISFPTGRATFKELKRVHDILSTVEIYGCMGDIKKTFLASSNETLKNKQKKVKSDKETKKVKKISKNKIFKNEIKNEFSKRKETIEKVLESSSEDNYELNLIWNDTEIDFSDLKEYEIITLRDAKGEKSN